VVTIYAICANTKKNLHFAHIEYTCVSKILRINSDYLEKYCLLGCDAM
jgi:hypothetical protein